MDSMLLFFKSFMALGQYRGVADVPESNEKTWFTVDGILLLSCGSRLGADSSKPGGMFGLDAGKFGLEDGKTEADDAIPGTDDGKFGLDDVKPGTDDGKFGLDDGKPGFGTDLFVRG